MRSLRTPIERSLATLLALLLAAPPALAQDVEPDAAPTLVEVLGGEVTLTRGAVLSDDLGTIGTLINASDGSAAHYSTFDIGSNAAVEVRFEIDGGSHLARVLSVSPTRIQGDLMSNGHVYLVNPAGVYFSEGASINVVGLHAAAGRIELDADGTFIRSADGSESSRYFDLEGTVENLGAITAEVVHLVGRHVVSSGRISSLGADGFFVLVVGDDVTIAQETGSEGELSVAVTIQGLAREVLEGLESPELVLGESSELLAGDGEIVLALGAGDLVGAAMQYAGYAEARSVTLAARGADVQVDGEIRAEQTELCAGSACFDASGTLRFEDVAQVPDRETGEPGELRELVRIGAGATFPEGSLRVQQEGDFALEAALEVQQQLVLVSGDSIALDERVSAATLAVGAGADGTGDLVLGAVALEADQIALRAGDATDTLASEDAPAAQVRIDPGASIRAAAADERAPSSFSITQDAALAAENVAAASQFGQVPDGSMSYTLRSQEGDIDLGAAIADKLGDDALGDDPLSRHWNLAIEAAGDLSVGADLVALELELRAGAGAGISATLAVGDALGEPVRLHADEIILRSGGGVGSSTIELDPDTVLRNTDDSAAPGRLTFDADGGIDEQLLLNRALQSLEIDDPLELTLASDGGLVRLDLDELEETDPAGLALVRGLLAQTELRLENGSRGTIEIDGDLSALAVALSSSSSATLTGNLEATDGDIDLEGRIQLFGTGEQKLSSLTGRITQRRLDGLSDLVRGDRFDAETQGNLVLEAGAAGTPIDIDGNVVVEGGSLEIRSDFSAAKDITVVARSDDGDLVENTGTFRIDGHALFDGVETDEETQEALPLDQHVTAQALFVSSTVEKTGGGVLELVARGRNELLGAVLVADALVLGGDDVVLVATELQVSDLTVRQAQELDGDELSSLVSLAGDAERITLESSAGSLTVSQALSSGAALTLRSAGAMSVEADVQVATLRLETTDASLAIGGVLLAADEIVLEAESADGSAAIALDGDTQFTNAAGDLLPSRLELRQSAALRVADFGAARATSLELASTGSDVTLDETFAREGTEALELRAAGDVSISADVVGLSSLRAEGGDHVLIGVTRTPAEDGVAESFDENQVQPLIEAARVELVAGDGGGGSAEVRVGSQTRFQGLKRFELTQEASIADGVHIPQLGLDYRGALILRSTGGSVLVSDASKDTVTGTELTLGGLNGVQVRLEGADTLEVASLTVVDEGPEFVGGDELELSQSVLATSGDIEIETDVVFLGVPTGPARELRSLYATSGNVIAHRDVRYLADSDLGLAAGSALLLFAGQEIRVDGTIEFESDSAGAVLLVGNDLAGGAISQTVRVREIITAVTRDEFGEPAADGIAAPAILISANGVVTLRGELDAGSRDDLAGDISIEAGGGIQLGSDAPLGARERIRLAGGAITLSGDVSRTPGLVEGTGEFTHELELRAQRDATLSGKLELDVLDVEADDAITLHGDVEASELIVLHSGLDGSGDVLLEGDRLAASRIELSAGTQDDGAGGAEILLRQVRLEGVLGSAPDGVAFAREAGFSEGDVRDFLSHLGEEAGQVAPGTNLTFQSLRGQVRIDAADVRDSSLTLFGREIELESGELGEAPVVVHVNVDERLDLQSLTLQSRALIGGDLRLRQGALSAARDLTVEGDVELFSAALFTRREFAEPDESGDPVPLGQTFSVTGSLRAPRIERSGAGELTVKAGGGIDLFGSPNELGGDSDGRIVSADGVGALSFASETGTLLLGGDVTAEGGITLGSPAVALSGIQDQRIVSRDGRVSAEVSLEKLGGRRARDRSLTLGGGLGFDVAGDLVAAQDLVLIGPGTLRGDASRVEAVDGDLLLGTSVLSGIELDEDAPPATGGINASALRLSAGGRIRVGGDGETPDEIMLLGNQIEIGGVLAGDGNLTVDVTQAGPSGYILFDADAELGDSSTLTLASEALAGIEFSAAPDGGTRRVRAGSILLNPQGREAAPRATIAAQGDLTLVAGDGHVEMGEGEILTALGALSVEASAGASLGQLNALSIDLRAPLIVANAPGVDWNANRVTASSQTGGVLVGTPTTEEVSAELVNDEMLLLALRDDLSPLTAIDLVGPDGLRDVTPSGPARFDSARQYEQPQSEPPRLPKQVLGHMNDVAAESRPLLAGELLDYLEQAAQGGEAVVELAAGQRRFQGGAFERALASYRDLFAPSARMDRATGTQVLRSHRPRIREALAEAIELFRRSGEPFTGAAFARHLETHGRYSEALFYVSGLRDLVDHALDAGLDLRQADRFRELLLRDLVPEGVPVELLVEVLGS